MKNIENNTLFYLYLGVFLTLLTALSLSVFYSKVKGPNAINEKISFYSPILISAILCIIMYLLPFSWIYLILNILFIIALNIVSFYALEKAMSDKTGMGVTIFSGLACMILIGFFTLLKLFKLDNISKKKSILLSVSFYKNI